MRTMPHIQKVLDRLFPGVKLRYNWSTGCWVLTDSLHFPNGCPAPDVYMNPTSAIRGATGSRPVNEGVMFVLKPAEGHLIEQRLKTREVREPNLDLILNQLRRAWHGNRRHEINRRVDVVEAAEDQEQTKQEVESRGAIRESARWAFDRSIGRVYSAGGVNSSYYSDPRKVERSIQKEMQEEARRDAEIDAAVREQAAEGKVCLKYCGSLWE